MDLGKLSFKIYNTIRPIRQKGTGNEIILPKKYKNVKILVYGNNNKILFAEDCILNNTEIIIIGDNNKVVVGSKAKFLGGNNATIYVNMINNGTFEVGEKASLRGVKCEINGAAIRIGKNVMTSFGIYLRNHDSHKVLSLETGEVTNPPADINIGDHVWLCEECTILKGVTVGNDSIVALKSLVTKDVPANSIAAGCPSKVVKTGISWDY
ncbi:MAG: acyltransferase [Paludibacteraceae bacterium]|nr:acyltransferase [Paludibacteraceae bacterium]